LRSGVASAEELLDLLIAFDDHVTQAGVGHVSEVFDGDPPHRPGGTIAQAWSEGELLRAWKMLDEDAARPSQDAPRLDRDAV
jgi:glycogen debranching enzyme